MNQDRFGVIIGSGIGGLPTIENQVIRLHEKGAKRVSPMFVPMAIANMAAGNIALRVGAKGICTAIVTACASGTNSIGKHSVTSNMAILMSFLLEEQKQRFVNGDCWICSFNSTLRIN